MVVDRLTDPVVQVASEIVRYLEEHPGASDGPSGIREFWLGGFRLPTGSQVIDQALDRLVDTAVLTRVALPGGESIYRLNKIT
jgi:hypothetical protein